MKLLRQSALVNCNTAKIVSMGFRSRLIRSEVETLVSEKYGKDHLNKKKWKKELADINKALKQIKAETLSQETRKAELLELLSDEGK
jgi:hypothetical protein